VVQHSAHNPRIKGSYPASGTGREKMRKFDVFSNKDSEYCHLLFHYFLAKVFTNLLPK